MSILTQALIFETYGPRLDIEQLAAVTGMARKTILNQISARAFGIKTYVDGGKRWADFRDVAEWFDTLRAQAR